MKFKVDENLPVDIAGIYDISISKICQNEQRILLTLDLGFSDIRTYPPSEHEGIIVLRLNRQDKIHVMDIARRVLSVLPQEEIKGKLWIVDEKRIRIRQ
jgi:predicted nuclease of predicted toxin-antitoxin system